MCALCIIILERRIIYLLTFFAISLFLFLSIALLVPANCLLLIFVRMDYLRIWHSLNLTGFFLFFRILISTCYSYL